jgi:hypothetical protein
MKAVLRFDKTRHKLVWIVEPAEYLTIAQTEFATPTLQHTT